MSFLIKVGVIELILTLLLGIYLDYEKKINGCIKDFISIIHESGVLLSSIFVICIVYIVSLVIFEQNTNTFNWWTIFLNLAYSYIVGFIVYVLTVSYPIWKRRKRNNGIIQRMISYIGAVIMLEFTKINLRMNILTITYDECFDIVDNAYNKNNKLIVQLIGAFDNINKQCDSFLLSHKEILNYHELQKIDNLKKVFVDSFIGICDTKKELDNLDQVRVLVWMCILRYRDLAVAFIPDLTYPE